MTGCEIKLIEGTSAMPQISHWLAPARERRGQDNVGYCHCRATRQIPECVLRAQRPLFGRPLKHAHVTAIADL
jgi:hypothetical protein